MLFFDSFARKHVSTVPSFKAKGYSGNQKLFNGEKIFVKIKTIKQV